MKITPEVEFNIIRNEDESRGFYVAVTDNYQLDALIQSMGHEDVPLFWETYDQEQGAATSLMFELDGKIYNPVTTNLTIGSIYETQFDSE